MNNTHPIAPLPGNPSDMGIDWEFQPSLQHLIRRGEPAAQDAPTWAETLPVPFEAFQEPEVFREALQGLSVRDLDEPEIFRVFFGPAEAPAARA